MEKRTIEAMLFAALAICVSTAAHAQRHFTNEEIVGNIGRCMVENAPDDWQTLIFKLEQSDAGSKKPPLVEHKVIAGTAASPPQDLKPCRDDYVVKAVNTFRENQDAKAKRWTGIVLTIKRDGSFGVDFKYPK